MDLPEKQVRVGLLGLMWGRDTGRMGFLRPPGLRPSQWWLMSSHEPRSGGQYLPPRHTQLTDGESEAKEARRHPQATLAAPGVPRPSRCSAQV